MRSAFALPGSNDQGCQSISLRCRRVAQSVSSAIEFERNATVFRANPIVVKSRDSQRRAISVRHGLRRVIEPEAQALFMYRRRTFAWPFLDHNFSDRAIYIGARYRGSC